MALAALAKSLGPQDAQTSALVNEVKSSLRTGEMISQVILITSVSLAILGVASLAIIPTIFFVTLSYFSYNSYRMCTNLHEIVENPQRYTTWLGFGNTFSADSLKAGMLKGTFCFEWCAEWIIDLMVSERLAQ